MFVVEIHYLFAPVNVYLLYDVNIFFLTHVSVYILKMYVLLANDHI